jgi:DnaJ-domain-containing protein 1
MAVWNRGNKPKSNDENVSLADDDHAWWAGRDELKKVFVPKSRSEGDLDEPARHSNFEDKYSTESLFNWADGPEPDDPTHGGQGTLLDPYAVLGLQPGATLDEVVNAHRSLAKRYHPDRQHGAGDDERQLADETMRRVNAAYHELRSRLTT